MIQAVESMGHRVLGMSADDEEALATAQAIRVDAVVVDVSGRFTGRRFTGRRAGAGDSSAMDRLLGQIAAPIVIVASGDPETGDMTHSGRDPAYLVTTPFQPPELKVMLNQALHNRA
jgi:CheY-like chemotaxis protein